MGSDSTGRKAPFNKRIYRRFELPRRLGEVISGWDDPEMAPGAAATTMRDDDYVIGLVHKGRAHAYPLWVVDHYHIVNDRIEDDRVLIVSCERCQTGAAFLASVKGNPARPPLFRGVGFMNATLIMRDLRTGSYWNHSVGECLSGRAEGTLLPWLPTFHIEWADWLAAHPDTVVMEPPRDPSHPDARHGHGRDEFFARPGMEPVFVPTITGELDTTYPENEVILAIGRDQSPAAFPLREVQLDGGVVTKQTERGRVVILAGPRADGFTMAAYAPRCEDQDLTLERRDGIFIDAETGSHWTIEGICVDGPCVGQRLTAVPWFYMRWHAWVYNHRDTKLYRSGTDPVQFGVGAVAEDPIVRDLHTLMRWLSNRGAEVRVEGPLVSQLRPRDSLASLVARIDGHRVRLHRFLTGDAAQDFHSLSGAWSGFPLKPKNLESRTWRYGALVIEGDPDDRFVDPLGIVPRAEDVVGSPAILDVVVDEAPNIEGHVSASGSFVGFMQIVRALRRRGVEVLEVAFLTPTQLRPKCENGIALTLEGDRFLLYRFEDEDSAREFSIEIGHAISCRNFVLRSVPATMYEHQGSEILYVGEEDTRWSALVDDVRIAQALEELPAAR